MTSIDSLLSNLYDNRIAILDEKISLETYVKIDLSGENKALDSFDIADPTQCQGYIDQILKEKQGLVAYGGYLEKRSLYISKRFSKDKIRDIHLGMDFWSGVGTKVITPITGKVHSFCNNKDIGNYGPTIILEHKINNVLFYTLYGHLSLESLEELYIGKVYNRGEVLCNLGAPAINVNYASHLHFQIIQ